MSWRDLKDKVKRFFDGTDVDARTNLPVQTAARIDEPPANRPRLVPAVNIIESEQELVLTADVPGAVREHTHVFFHGTQTLVIQASIQGTGDARAVFSERRVGDWYRIFQIPSYLDGDKATSGLVDGVLTVRIPRRKDTGPKLIPVRRAA